MSVEARSGELGDVVRGSRPDRTLSIRVLGPLRLCRAGEELPAGPRQQQCLLALLLAKGGAPVSLGEMIELLWGDDAPPSAVNVVHKYIGAVRRLLEPELKSRDQGSWLRRDARGYQLVVGPDVLDLAAFRRSVTAAREQARAGHCARALDLYGEALELWRGPAGASLADSTAAQAVFAALDRERVDVTREAAEAALRVGKPARALPALRQVVGLNRFDEPLHATLIAALAAAGHQAEALTVFRTIQGRLAEDLGIDVGPELQAAHQRVLRQQYSVGGEPATGSAAGPAEDPGPATSPVRDPVVRPAQLPPDLANFVGRRDEMRVLRELTGDRTSRAGSAPLIVALSGMGGVGKSTLAVQFASTLADRFPDGQLYLDLRGHEAGGRPLSTETALRALLHAFGVAGPQLPDTISSQMGMYRSLSAGKRILMLVDNACDAAQVRPLLPRSAESVVLVTSRVAMVGLAATDGAALLHVPLPDQASARALLIRRLPPHCADDDPAIDEVVRLCGRLPLALAIVAARMSARPGLSASAAAAELGDGAGRLDALSGGNDLIDPRTVFSWSYQHLSEGAARLFRHLAVLPECTVSAAACASAAGLDLPTAQSLLRELSEAVLITGDDDRFGSHVLVKAYAGELFRSTESASEQDDAVRRLLQHHLHSSYQAQVVLRPHGLPIRPAAPMPGAVVERPATYDEAMAWFGRERRVLIGAVERAAALGHAVTAWQLALTLQQYLQWRGYFHDWADVSRVALRAARAAENRIGEAHMLHSLAGARFHFAAYDEALELLRSALDLFDACGRTLQQGFVHTNLGEVLNVLGRGDEALTEHRRALRLYRSAGNGRAQARALSDIGDAFGRLGDDDQAADALSEALALNERLGNMHEVAEVLVDLAEVQRRLGRPGAAVGDLERAIEIARLVGQLPIHFRALIGLADARAEAGDLAGAREAWANASAVADTFQYGGTDTMREQLQRVNLTVELGSGPRLSAAAHK